MPHQLAVTIRAFVQPGLLADLEDVLADIAKRGVPNDTLPFDALLGVHFARLFVLPEAEDAGGETIRPSLVYMAEVDAPVDRHFAELAEAVGGGLDLLFGHCVDYPPTPVMPSLRVTWLREHALTGGTTYYVNTVGRGLTQIRLEAQLREAIEGFLDQAGAGWVGRSALEVRARIQQFVSGRPDLVWASLEPDEPSLRWRSMETVHAVAVPLVGLALSPILVPILPVWAGLLRWHERCDVPGRQRPDPARLLEVAEREDFAAQNPFTAVGVIKPGLFRRVTASTVLTLVDYGLRHIFNHGSLTGVKTIHFARWVFIDEHRRLVFASNYDGSLESYMGDFIDLVGWGLNAVFSNGVGYPRTRWLVLDGARDEQAFKNYLHCRQLVTQVWYSAYPSLTGENINTNARLRQGLFGRMTEAEAQTWLALL